MHSFSIHRAGTLDADKTFRDAEKFVCDCVDENDEVISCTSFSQHAGTNTVISELDEIDTNLLADRILAETEEIQGGTFEKEILNDD